jgi:hypothetical protein
MGWVGRRFIFAWLGDPAKRILNVMDHARQRDLRQAWHHAVFSWLRHHGLIGLPMNHQRADPF